MHRHPLDEAPGDPERDERDWARDEIARGRAVALWTPQVGRQVVVSLDEWDAAKRARSLEAFEAWRRQRQSN